MAAANTTRPQCAETPTWDRRASKVLCGLSKRKQGNTIQHTITGVRFAQNLLDKANNTAKHTHKTQDICRRGFFGEESGRLADSRVWNYYLVLLSVPSEGQLINHLAQFFFHVVYLPCALRSGQHSSVY